MKNIDIFTDGACSTNIRLGGWAAILKYKKYEKIISGYEIDTTNNRMELTAVIKALELLKEDKMNIKIYSDSAYVVNAFNFKWIEKWQNNNWNKIKNIDLWIKLLKYTKINFIKFIKVKGHADNEYNNRCDKLAVQEIIKIKKLNLNTKRT